LYQELTQNLEAVDGMNAAQLEKAVQEAKGVALEIEGLIPQFEGPPVLQ